MSELRANILVFLTREAGHIREVPVDRVYDRLPLQYRCERAAIDAALSDLRGFGLIEVNPRGISLSRIVPRPKSFKLDRTARTLTWRHAERRAL